MNALTALLTYHNGFFRRKADRIQFAKKLKPSLKSIDHGNRNLVIDHVIRAFCDVEVPKLMMNWDDLRQLHIQGHYIGSHTVTHCLLGTMNNEEVIKDELYQSAKKIEQHLGYFPLSISYPVGSFNQTTVRLSREVGYKIGLAVKQAVYDPSRDSCFEIPRIELYNEFWWKTRLRITNHLEQIKSLLGYANV